MTSFSIPYGGSTVSAEAPSSFEVEICEPPAVDPRPLEDAVRRALSDPLDSPRLREAARGKRDAVVVVPDASRPLSPSRALPPILDEILTAGVPEEKITVIVGLGLHRVPDADELARHVDLADHPKVRVVAHDVEGPMADLGTGPMGVPLRVARAAAVADLLVAVGWVEPHQYAGFSGGYKTAVIGLGSEEIIGATHSPRFIDDPRCRPGSVSRNPFQSVLREAGSRMGLEFVVNAIPRSGGVAAAAAGAPWTVLSHLAGKAEEVFAVYRGEPADAAVVGVSPPKDRNLYQASRAVTNLGLGPVPAVRDGGVFILPACLPDGPGRGTGERRFAASMREGVPAVLARRNEAKFRGGEQRAYVLAKVLKAKDVVVAGAKSSELGGMPLSFAPDLEGALSLAEKRTGGGRLVVFPDAIDSFLGADGT